MSNRAKIREQAAEIERLRTERDEACAAAADLNNDVSRLGAEIERLRAIVEKAQEMWREYDSPSPDLLLRARYREQLFDLLRARGEVQP